MKLTYITTNLNRYTFKSKKIKEWTENRCEGRVLNLFAGNILLNVNEVRNDIDKSMNADYYMDALDFIKYYDLELNSNSDNELLFFDTILIDSPYCYDKKTEVLTDQGWKYFKDLNKTEKIATLNPQTNYLEYQKPIQYINQIYKGEMIQIKSGSIDLNVTPNHKLYIKKNWKTNQFKLIEAQTVDFGCNFKTTCKWKGKNKKFFILPRVSFIRHDRYNNRYAKPKKIEMSIFLKFLGIYLAEGCIDNKGTNYRIRIAQTKKPNRIIIEKWLKELGYKYTIEKKGYSISNKQLWTYLKQFGKTQNKFIPKNIKSLSIKYLNYLLEGLMLGDGHYKKELKFNKQYGKYYIDSHRSYCSISKKLIDDVQEIALKCGYRSYCFKQFGKAYTLGYCYTINLSKYRNTPKIVKNKIKQYIQKVKYNDKVYCVEIPKYNIIYVRRNGRPCWCGNSYRKGMELYNGHYSSRFKQIADNVSNILTKDGKIISFGYHNSFVGKKRGYILEELCVFGHGGAQHCTIAIVERKIKEKNI